MNIFNIEKDLLSIFAEIEDNEGELTPEVEEKLAITKDNFNNKITNHNLNLDKMNFHKEC